MGQQDGMEEDSAGDECEEQCSCLIEEGGGFGVEAEEDGLME